jgi:O-antigen ligase
MSILFGHFEYKLGLTFAWTCIRWSLGLVASPTMKETRRERSPAAIYPESLARASPREPQATAREVTQSAVHRSLRSLGFYFGMAYVFVVFTQLHELIMTRVGINTFLLSIISVPTFSLVLTLGGLQRTLRWRVARYWLAFTALMILAVPFSTWRGESLWVTVSWIRAGLPVLFVIAALVITIKEFNTLMTILAWAAVVDVVAGHALAAEIRGRLELNGTSVSDPNDYSAQLILLLPFLLFVFLSKWRTPMIRASAAIVAVYGLFLILSTGSRGGLAAVVVALLFLVSKLRLGQKIMVGLIVLVLSLGSMAMLPQRILFRFSTIFGSPDTQNMDQDTLAAIGSKEERVYLLQQSILATLSHPLFGVGPGEFQNYEGNRARELHQQGAWHQTHNSFTQVSSEIGIPALICYLAAIIATYRMLARAYQQTQESPPSLNTQRLKLSAFCLIVSLAGFCAGCFFLSLAYRFYLPALTGLAIALTRAVQNERTIAAAATNANLAA